ncbi:MAG: hypothetical protein ABIH36_03135 [bacterium]
MKIENYKLKISHLKTPLVIIFSINLALNILLWLLALFLFPHNNPSAVLHYNIDVGIDFIGESKQIVMLPIAGLLLLAGNSLLAAVLRSTNQRSALLLCYIIPILQLILIGAFILVWQANQ